MTKGKNTSAIGKREERQIVKDLQALGYDCRRQPGSGNRAVDLQHDVVWKDSPAGKLHIECKYREKSIWKNLQNQRSGADILTLACDARRADQDGETMVFMPWKLFLEIAGEAEGPVVIRENVLTPENKMLNANRVWDAQHNLDVVGRKGCKATQTTYTPPPKRKPPQRNKLQGRKFQRKAT